MALSKLAGDLTELITCAVCLENFTHRDPRGLNCQHAFCVECLYCMYKTRKANDPSTKESIVCPTCQEQTSLPGHSVYSLKSYFVAEQVKDALSGLSHVTQCDTTMQCTRCRKSNDIASYCFDCAHLICQECLAKHNQRQGNKFHVNIGVSNANIKSLICQDHGEFATDFCSQCSTIACSTCHSTTHQQNHKVVDFCLTTEDIRSAGNNVVQAIDAQGQKEAGLRDHHSQYRAQAQLTMELIDQQVHTIVADIITQGKVMKAKVSSTLTNIEAIMADTATQGKQFKGKCSEANRIMSPLTDVPGLSLDCLEAMTVKPTPSVTLPRCQDLVFTPRPTTLSILIGTLRVPASLPTSWYYFAKRTAIDFYHWLRRAYDESGN